MDVKRKKVKRKLKSQSKGLVRKKTAPSRKKSKIEKVSQIKKKQAVKKSLSQTRKLKTTSKLISQTKKTIKESTKKGGSFLNELEQELERILEKNRQVSIKGSEGFEYCFEENCDQPSTTHGYCRYHYMVSWQDIKARTQILSENKLRNWIQELISTHSNHLLDFMVRDFSNEKDFFTALAEMKIISKNGKSY